MQHSRMASGLLPTATSWARLSSSTREIFEDAEACLAFDDEESAVQVEDEAKVNNAQAMQGGAQVVGVPVPTSAPAIRLPVHHSHAEGAAPQIAGLTNGASLNHALFEKDHHKGEGGIPPRESPPARARSKTRKRATLDVPAVIEIFLAKPSKSTSKKDARATSGCAGDASSRADFLARRHRVTSKAVRDIWTLRTWKVLTQPFWHLVDH
jgi:hypothetical protein